jgi:hypothetical protein
MRLIVLCLVAFLTNEFARVETFKYPLQNTMFIVSFGILTRDSLGSWLYGKIKDREKYCFDSL